MFPNAIRQISARESVYSRERIKLRDGGTSIRPGAAYGSAYWPTPVSLPGFAEQAANRRAPQLHPYADSLADPPIAICPVALAYETEVVGTSATYVECRGLWVDDQDPSNSTLWHWTAPTPGLRGNGPSLTNWNNGGYGLFYTGYSPSAPYALVMDSVDLRYSPQRWVVDYSPLHFTETHHVLAGDTIVIDAGVQVLFDSAAALVVDSGAVLMVNGTAQNRVVFDAATSGQKWRGLRVYSDSPSNRLDYATISNAVNGVEVWNGQLSLNSTFIDHCRNYGAVYANSNGDWRRNDIRQCGRQGAFLISSEVSIDSCTITQNTRAGLRLVGGDYHLLRSRINGNRAIRPTRCATSAPASNCWARTSPPPATPSPTTTAPACSSSPVLRPPRPRLESDRG